MNSLPVCWALDAGGYGVLLETRRALGAFYTPADLAGLIAEWAIDRAGLRILEPSVGSGALVDAALSRLEEVGGGSVVGYEIDGDTVDRLSRFRADSRVDVHRADFFEVSASAGFDLVVANPPFTRNHDLTVEARRTFRKRAEIAKVARGAPGLWVYFLLASLPHLRKGGRLAFIVPGAVEFADYALPLLDHLRENFAAVELVAIDTAIAWEGAAQERAAVLLASDYGAGPAACVTRRRTRTDGSMAPAQRAPSIPFVSAHVLLGDLARLEIGSVTGANDFFLMSHHDVLAAGLMTSAFTLAAARARHVVGLSVGSADLAALAIRGERTYLLSPSSLGDRGGPIRNYLARIDRRRRASTVWLNKRSPWWKVQIGDQFDGIFTYMNHSGPRLALLEPGLAATNTLHKVTFKSRDVGMHRTACVSLLTTYSQLHAEAVGRVYGGGVLKFELKDARRLPVLIPEKAISGATYARIDTALRAKAFETARSLADAAILPEFFGSGWSEVAATMAAELERARAVRASTAAKRSGIRSVPP